MRYMFSGKPFTSRTEFEGHAVRALYAASGATDYFTEAGDPAFKKTLDLLWTDLTTRKMYITGGVGSRARWRKLRRCLRIARARRPMPKPAPPSRMSCGISVCCALTGDARYADVLERAFTTASTPACRCRKSVLLPQSAGFERRKASQSLVRHDLLPAEHRAAVRIAARATSTP